MMADRNWSYRDPSIDWVARGRTAVRWQRAGYVALGVAIFLAVAAVMSAVGSQGG